MSFADGINSEYEDVAVHRTLSDLADIHMDLYHAIPEGNNGSVESRAIGDLIRGFVKGMRGISDKADTLYKSRRGSERLHASVLYEAVLEITAKEITSFADAIHTVAVIAGEDTGAGEGVKRIHAYAIQIAPALDEYLKSAQEPHR